MTEAMAGPDYILDIPALKAERNSQAPADQSSLARPWLAIKWTCCNAYSRIYRNRAGTAYAGHCPKCAKPLHIKVGSGGTSCRFFEAQ